MIERLPELCRILTRNALSTFSCLAEDLFEDTIDRETCNTLDIL
jgi:hypothetical protein